MPLKDSKQSLFSKWGLQAKLLVPLLSVIVIIMSSVSFVQYQISAKDLSISMQVKAQGLATLLANISVNFIVNFDLSALERFVEHSLKDSSIAYVVFYDENNKPLTEKSKKPEDVSLYLNVSENILQEGKTLGRVEIGYHLESVKQAKRKGLVAMILGIAITLISIFALMWVTIHNVINSVNHISANLQETGQQLLVSAQGVSESADKLASSNTSQSIFVDKSMSAVSEFEQALSLASENVQKSTKFARESEESVLRGKDVVEQLLAAFELISSSNNKLNENIQKNLQNLSEVVNVIQSIGAQTQAINDIVFQTKLLSFNASVEAARAGVHGRGFSIVAEEVRKLAEMSGAAALQITSLLNSSIQNVTLLSQKSEKEMSATSLEVTSRIKDGTTKIHHARHVFEEIEKSISLTVNVTEEIEKTVKEQSSGVQDIAMSMKELSLSIEKTKTVSDSQSTTANELLIKSEFLEKATVELRELVRGSENDLKKSSPNISAENSPQRFNAA
jgi:methyl-accepting chemotaxis protein